MNMKKTVLMQPFVNICPDIDEFLKADNEHGVVSTIDELCRRINKLSAKYADRIDENKFKGDAFELFVEYMIKTGSEDNRIGIYDYQIPSEIDEEDLGVDGIGVGENGFPATVQVKYRQPNYVLTANNDHLSNFLTSSIFDYNVRMEDDKNMLIVTTAKKVDEFTLNSMLKGKVRVLNHDALQEMYDGRPEWWKRFYEAVRDSRAVVSVKHNTLKLRLHQEEAIKAISDDSNLKGKIILPPGTGKTLIEADYIRKFIQENKKYSPVVKINSPRILLCFQLFDDVFLHLRNHGIQARYINYNSGNKDDKEYSIAMRNEGWNYREILSTTNIEEVKKVYDKCMKERLPLIVFSTYHSSEKFSTSGIVPDLTIHDEAHNLVSRNFWKAAQLPSGGNIFFTATEKVTDSDEDKGMNNPNIFDNLIYTKSAKELIDEGEMTPPYLHVVRSTNDNRIDTDYPKMLESIIEAFNAHERKIKEVSYSAQEIGAKVLVVCRGQEDLKNMLKSEVIEYYKSMYPDIHLFALSSDFGICNDGIVERPVVTNMKKHRLLKRLKALKSEDRALIFHVDMIGEGIDVPCITGVMPFRNCEESKLIQNVGRATRLHPIDRKRFYRGKIDVSSRNEGKWIKPYSWVIIPSYMVDAEGMEGRFRSIIDCMRSEFGYIPQQHTVIDNVTSDDKKADIDIVNDKKKCKRGKKSGIDAFEHEFEKVSCIEKIIENDQIYVRSEEIIASMFKASIIKQRQIKPTKTVINCMPTKQGRVKPADFTSSFKKFTNGEAEIITINQYKTWKETVKNVLGIEVYEKNKKASMYLVYKKYLNRDNDSNLYLESN